MMSIGIPAFEHDALQDSSKQIRVLTIHPADDGDEGLLCCSLDCVDLTRHGHSCLSYRWGTDEATCVILVNGYSFLVRPNLYRFLIQARTSEFHRPIWIDAICVNQSDNAEKSAQVQQMGEIYSFAEMTLVWLGVPIQVLDEVLDAHHRLPSVFPKMGELEDSGPTREFDYAACSGILTKDAKRLGKDVIWFAACQITHEELTKRSRTFVSLYDPLFDLIDDVFESLKAIANDPYWTRTWIVQEILLSPTVLFFTSSEPVSLQNYFILEELLYSIRTVHVEELDDDFIQNCQRKLTDFRERSWLHEGLQILKQNKLPLELADAIEITHRAGCSDIRDRVFSIHALLAPHDQFIVDYEMDCAQLFHQIVRAQVQLDPDRESILKCIELLIFSLSIDLPARPVPLPLIRDVLENYRECQIIPPDIFWAAASQDSSGRGCGEILCLTVQFEEAHWLVVQLGIEPANQRGSYLSIGSDRFQFSELDGLRAVWSLKAGVYEERDDIEIIF